MEPIFRQTLSLRSQLGRRWITSASNNASRCKQSPTIRAAFRRHASTSSTTSSAPKTARIPRTVLAAFVTTSIATSLYTLTGTAEAEAPPNTIDNSSDISFFRLSEVKKHGKEADRIWVTRGNRVYDITEWIPNHPGGEIILRGVGGCLEPYWKIFSVHNKQEVFDILEEYFIGLVDPRDLVDGQVPEDNIDDPFKHDPDRDSRLEVLTQRPCNAETPGEDLGDYITPNELFYVRNHMWVPDDEAAKNHNLTIELPDGEEVTYTMEDLKQKFQEYTVTAVLQCSGNRRSHMHAIKPTNGLQWNVGAIGNAEWTGVKLRDVLKDAGVDVDAQPSEEIKHAWFMGSEAYSASIPIDKATDPRGDVILAYGMNGQPLPRDHGYPLRVLVPGVVAARSVKWVNRITLAEEESYSQWQRKDYKCFGPNEGKSPPWEKAVSIQETPVQSAITRIWDVSRGQAVRQTEKPVEEDSVAVEGYAFSGGGRGIVRVDISSDGGETWDQANLMPCEDPKGFKNWGWKRWAFVTPRSKVGGCFVIKAVDDSYNGQPENFKDHYNFRGNLATGWHKVPYQCGDKQAQEESATAEQKTEVKARA